MSDTKQIFAFPSPKSDVRDLRAAKPVEAKPKKFAIILDMGEASREEGFRLNGCR